MFFYLICVLLFGSPYLLQLNISFKIQYFISLVLLFLYFIYEKKFILPWNKLRIFVLFFLLTAIDKLNGNHSIFRLDTHRNPAYLCGITNY